MSISTTIRKAGPFIGNNTATAFAFAFKVFAASDLLVAELDTTGVQTTLTLNSDYSVTLNGDQDSNPGGTVTLLAGPLATGLTLVITSGVAELQGTVVTNQSGFYPDLFNGSLDLLTVLVQQLRELATRTIAFPLTSAPSTPVLPSAQVRAGKLLMFDSNGDLALMSLAPGSGVPGAQVAAGAVDGVNRDFTFLAAAGTTPIPLVFAAGIFQTVGTDYSVPVFVSGSMWKFTLTTAPPNGPITVLQLA